MEFFLAGSLAGLISDAIVHPIDTIRTRLQMQTSSNPIMYRSGTDALVKITRSEGVAALYRGFGIVALATIPGHALYFYGYEQSKSYLTDKLMPDSSGTNAGEQPKWRQVAVHLTSGMVADVFGSLAWTPMDVIKQRMQIMRTQQHQGSHSSSKMSSLRLMLAIINREGPLGLYRGFFAALATYGPYVSIYFALYEQWKVVMIPQQTSSEHLHIYLTGAALSGALSATITCPLDVIKTRIQVGTAGDTSHRYFASIRQIYQHEGPAAFFKGIRPRALWMASGTAITMAVYEQLKIVMNI